MPDAPHRLARKGRTMTTPIEPPIQLSPRSPHEPGKLPPRRETRPKRNSRTAPKLKVTKTVVD